MASTQSFFNILKKRWGIKSNFHVFIILIVFSLTGFSVLYVEEQILRLMNVSGKHSFWMGVLLFIVVTLPVYNILLLVYGLLLGQFSFFWNFEKKFFGKLLWFFKK
jgi:hypothetical protein